MREMRQLSGERFEGAVRRLAAYEGSVTVAWASVPSAAGQPQVAAVTVRPSSGSEPLDLDYGRLSLCRKDTSATTAARWLETGRPPTRSKLPYFQAPKPEYGTADWIPSGQVYGMLALLLSATFYFSHSLGTREELQKARLDDPLFGPNLPYFPTAHDGLLEVLCGLTRDQGRRDIFEQIIVQLPYGNAYLQRLEYLEDAGLLVHIGSVPRRQPDAYAIEIRWKSQPSELAVRRAKRTVLVASHQIAFDEVKAPPAWLEAALLDPAGDLIDSKELPKNDREHASYAGTSDPLAVSEAIDHLAVAWQQLFRKPLLRLDATTGGQLTTPVIDRSTFSEHLSALASLYKAMTIDDDLVSGIATEDEDKSHTLQRLRFALGARVTDEGDRSTVDEAVRMLQRTNRLRVAMQHPNAEPPLSDAFANLGIDYPVDWTVAWSVIQEQVVAAARQVRQVLAAITSTESPSQSS